MKYIYVLLDVAGFISFGCGSSSSTSSADSTILAVPDTTTASAPVPDATPFSKEVSFYKITFKLSSPNSATGNSFTLTPSGFTEDNTPVTMPADGGKAQVTGIEVDDIDNDNKAEVMVVTSEGPDSTGKTYVFSSNNDKSMSMVNLPDMPQDDVVKDGYKGHDAFHFVERTFVRLFPVYKDGAPTGKYHQFQYKLKPGEASKQLKLDKTVDF